MSRKIIVQCEIRNMLILKDTLKQLGHNFNEIDADVVEINRSYHPIRINAKTGKTSLDEMNQRELDEINQMYTVNFLKDQAIKEGNQVKQETLASGEIVVYYL